MIHNPNYWDDVQSGKWEPDTFDVMQKYLSKNHSYIDIGAWIGPTVLFGSQLSKRCFAFEPDPVALTALQRNLVLNPNITNVIVEQAAVNHSTGTANLGVKIGRGDSMSSLMWRKDTIEVNTISLQDVLLKHAINDLNFIKMDIEGAEVAVLPAIKDLLKELKTITLYVSLHTQWFPNTTNAYLERVIDSLSNYKNIYLADGRKISLGQITQLTGFNAIIATND